MNSIYCIDIFYLECSGPVLGPERCAGGASFAGGTATTEAYPAVRTGAAYCTGTTGAPLLCFEKKNMALD